MVLTNEIPFIFKSLDFDSYSYFEKAKNYKLLVKVDDVRSVSGSVLNMDIKEACEKGKNKSIAREKLGCTFSGEIGAATICKKSK